MTSQGFREALIAAYLEVPCEVLPNPLWRTLAELERLDTNFGKSQDRVSQLEAMQGNNFYVYWRRAERQSSYLVSRRLSYASHAIMHQDFLDPNTVAGFTVRMSHFRLSQRGKAELPILPDGLRFADVNPEKEAAFIAAFIGQHHQEHKPSAEMVLEWTTRPVFDKTLWVWVKDNAGVPLGLGIAEFDGTIREAMIEWVQVLPAHQSKGIGKAVVLELLRRIGERAIFTTVMGTVEDRDNPGAFFRKCGFEGRDVWWLLER